MTFLEKRAHWRKNNHRDENNVITQGSRLCEIPQEAQAYFKAGFICVCVLWQYLQISNIYIALS